jgi:hypothetical protein
LPHLIQFARQAGLPTTRAATIDEGRLLGVQEYLVALDVAALREDATDRMRARAAAALDGAMPAR